VIKYNFHNNNYYNNNHPLTTLLGDYNHNFNNLKVNIGEIKSSYSTLKIIKTIHSYNNYFFNLNI
jgi:hypothetical protein